MTAHRDFLLELEGRQQAQLAAGDIATEDEEDEDLSPEERVNLLNAVRERLILEKSENIEIIASIRNQLIRARPNPADSHDDRLKSRQFTDPDWYRRAMLALRYRGRYDQFLAQQMGRISRKIRQQNTIVTDIHRASEKLTFLSAFFQLAKQRLDPLLLDELIAAAHSIANPQDL